MEQRREDDESTATTSPAATVNVHVSGGIGIFSQTVFLAGSRPEKECEAERIQQPNRQIQWPNGRQPEAKATQDKSLQHVKDRIVDQAIRSECKKLLTGYDHAGNLSAQDIFDIQVAVKSQTGKRPKEPQIRSKFRSVKDCAKRETPARPSSVEKSKDQRRINVDMERGNNSGTAKEVKNEEDGVNNEEEEEEETVMEQAGNSQQQEEESAQPSLCRDMNFVYCHLRAAFERMEYMGRRMGWDRGESNEEDATTIPSHMEEL